MSTTAHLTDGLWRALQGSAATTPPIRFSGRGSLASAFPVSDLASVSIGVAALAAAAVASPDDPRPVSVDRGLASHWFAWSLRPDGWQPPAPWDVIAGDYRTDGGWIKLHTNAPHHRAAALAVLDITDARNTTRNQVAARVAAWSADDLERAVVAAGGCAATMRGLAAWRSHPQGLAVAAEPLARVDTTDTATTDPPEAPRDRPLEGLRVLDLTRVLAGPVATRFLALLGAEVLRVDPPGWDEPAVIPEVTPGKRCARIDLTRPEGRERFVTLLRDADILVHGYRPGALDGLGFDAATRRVIRPGLVDVSLDAYGWTGPWAGRRGFDSLVQMSSGIAAAGMTATDADQPVPLPVPALDHATGYLMAASALLGLARRRDHGAGSIVRHSLARTAGLLVDAAATDDEEPLNSDPPLDDTIETTTWGPARRVRLPCAIDGVRLGFDRPATGLGTSRPEWQR